MLRSIFNPKCRKWTILQYCGTRKKNWTKKTIHFSKATTYACVWHVMSSLYVPMYIIFRVFKSESLLFERCEKWAETDNLSTLNYEKVSMRNQVSSVTLCKQFSWKKNQLMSAPRPPLLGYFFFQTCPRFDFN